MPLIEVNDLSYTYLAGTPLANPALFDISLRIEAGEVIVLLGQSGAGKTTLLQFLNALYRPAIPGRVKVLGVDTVSSSDTLRSLRLKVGLLLQRVQAQIIERFVGDDIAFVPRQLNLPHDEVRRRVQKAMAMVGLDFEKFKDKRTFNLSGGEMRKVALAGLLAGEPEVLLLDEPTAGLDPESVESLLTLIGDLRRDGRTVIIASTSVEELPLVADRILVLDSGHLVAEIAKNELWRYKNQLREYGLDLPELTAIIAGLQEHGIPVPTNIQDSESLAGAICKILPTYAT